MFTSLRALAIADGRTGTATLVLTAPSLTVWGALPCCHHLERCWLVHGAACSVCDGVQVRGSCGGRLAVETVLVPRHGKASLGCQDSRSRCVVGSNTATCPSSKAVLWQAGERPQSSALRTHVCVRSLHSKAGMASYTS